jgi:NTE family protein
MDLAALTVGADAQSASEALTTWVLDRPSFAPISVGHILRAPRLPHPAMLLGLAKLTARQRVVPVAALSMLLPDGREMLAPHLEFLDNLPRNTTNDQSLLVCAVRRRDWRRTVFNSQDPTVSLSAALAASCAVPGYFAGVTINGETFVDGGAISATNADILRRHDLDLAIIVSPMTGKAHWPSMSHLVRRLCRRTLDAELRSLRHQGIPTVVLEPGTDVTRHMSMDFMSETASTDIVQSAFLDTGAQIANNATLRTLQMRQAA